jgi:hypothetical protein
MRAFSGRYISPNPRLRNAQIALARAPVGGGGVSENQVMPDGSVQTIPGVQAQIPRGVTLQYNVLVADTVALAVNFDRKFLFILNNDVLGDVWGAWGVPAKVGVGMKFKAGGGGIMLDNNVPTAELHLIGTIASNQNFTIISG